MGGANQPDFGDVTIWFYGKDKTIELKSLKQYIFQYRDTRLSYERALDVMYKNFKAVYEPDRIRIEIEYRPRGGISSRMIVVGTLRWY